MVEEIDRGVRAGAARKKGMGQADPQLGGRGYGPCALEEGILDSHFEN